jgi:hypothetical protein
MGIIIIIPPPLHLASECQSLRKCCKLPLLVIAKTAVEGRLRIRQPRERGSHASEAFSALAHAFRWIGRKPLLLPHLHPFASVVAQPPICRLERGPVLFLLGAQPQTLLERSEGVAHICRVGSILLRRVPVRSALTCRWLLLSINLR